MTNFKANELCAAAKELGFFEASFKDAQNVKVRDEIRAICSDAGLSVASRKDSQDICFVPDGDYASFITKLTNYTSVEGNYIDENGKVLGKHKGNIHYTVGQRKGLGISYEHPLYVININKETNEITLGKEEELYSNELEITDVNLLVDNLPTYAQGKIRYRYELTPCKIEQIDNNKLIVIFDKPVKTSD